ncbi:hypothetical protein [Actinomadura sp. 9N407]|uniref:hypothetical protein n=1 Tax=Actinomadura sp. 9N407 TaxID=3375154 RepID=UPI0037BC1914
MARQMVYRYGSDRVSPGEAVGWFDPDRAEAFVEVGAVTDEQYAQWQRKGKGGIRGIRETLHRTESGRWVLRRDYLDGPQGPETTWEFVDRDDDAVDWLTRNGHEQALPRVLPDLPAETGPGRPEIGGRVQVRLGELLPQVDRYADHHGMARAEAVRILVGIGLKESDT